MISNGRYISLIKAASKAEAAGKGGEMLGKLLRKGSKAAKKVQHHMGEAGAGVARGLGKNEETGRAVAKAVLPTVGTGAAATSDTGKRLRAQHGILVPREYGGMF